MTNHARPKRIVFATSQSNVAGVGEAPWSPPDNLFVWNGGYWSPSNDATAVMVGDAFVPPDPTKSNLAIGYAAEIAREYPGEDVYLIMVARGGTGVRAFVGMAYDLSSSFSGDPGTGQVGFNANAPGAINTIRYSKTDREANVRFFGGTTLGTPATAPGQLNHPGRVEQVGNEANCFIEFNAANATYVEATAHRSQAITVTSSANWPPPSGAQVRVFPMLPRMGTIMSQNINAAFAALGLTGADRKFDHVLLWPTEGDMQYPLPYEKNDFPRLMSRIEGFVDWATPICMPLPWPYGAGNEAQRQAWYDTLWGIAADDPRIRTVDLDRSGAANWADHNLVHVADHAKITMGRNTRIAERR